MKKLWMKASMFVMGLIAYLILSITCYQNAYAEKLGGDELGMHTVGGLYELYQNDDAKLYVIYAVAGGLNAVVNARAMEDCRTGDKQIDWSCFQDTRQFYANILSSYVRETGREATNPAVVQVFWYWAVDAEFDETANAGIAMALFVQNCWNYYADKAAETLEQTGETS